MHELLAAQIQKSMQVELDQKFGNGNVQVPTPPNLLEDIQKRSQAAGFDAFDPMFIFPVHINTSFPQKSSPVYVELANQGLVPDKIAPGRWILWDSHRRPGATWNDKNRSSQKPLPNDKKVFENDRVIGSIVAQLRREELISSDTEIPYLKGIPPSSRFAISPGKLREHVFPRLAKTLGIEDEIASGQVDLRAPEYLEILYASHLRYPELGTVDTGEHIDDVVQINGDTSYYWTGRRTWVPDTRSSMIGSKLPPGHYTKGLHELRTFSKTLNFPLGSPNTEVAFRPVIVFN